MQLCKIDDAKACKPTSYSLVRMFFGWLMTAFAVMLGAPFWFDMLNKFMVIRSTVKPREKSREEGSEDRADPAKDAASAPAAAAAAMAAATTAASPHVSTDASPQASVVPAQPFVPHEWRDGIVNPKEIPL